MHSPDWRDWYQLERWRRRRRHQLRVEPLCAMCLKLSKVEPATIADHVVSHRGDWNEFWLGELQSLCKPCHDSRKKVVDLRGYDPEIGADGWPLDQRHPVYR
jgi:5-methylcytosine-specific restriction enzyme A